MKKIAVYIMSACLLFTCYPLWSNAQTYDVNFAAKTSVMGSQPEETPEAKVMVLKIRYNEITAMDKSKMTKLQKKNLRKEARSIRRQIHKIDGSVYVSGVVVLVLSLLLIVLL